MEAMVEAAQNKWGWIHLAHVQLSTVYKTLYNDIALFVTRQSIDIYEGLSEESLKEMEMFKTIEALKVDINNQVLTWEQVQQIPQRLEVIQETFVKTDPEILRQPKSKIREMHVENSYATQLRIAMKELHDELEEEFVDEFSEEKPLSLKILAQNNDVIRSVTERWALYREAWEQRLLYREAEKRGENFDKRIKVWRDLWSTKWRDIMVGDHIVRDLYSIVQLRNLNFQCNEPPIVVPFMTRLYATGFGSSLPVIVTPYWGSRQVWTWLGYAHEIGHHIFRNVQGLQEAIRARIGFQLWLSGASYEIQSLWFNWLEEVFADIIGLLLIGPTAARSMRWMLLYLPLEVIEKLDEDEQRQNKHDYRDGLFQAADDTHPIPYLRVKIAFTALKILGRMSSQELKQLSNGWDAFFEGNHSFQGKETKVMAYVRESDNAQKLFKYLTVEEIEKIEEMVIETILTTKFNALADQKVPQNETKPRCLCDVFFEELDRYKVEAAGRAITEKESTKGYGMRHLLVAIVEKLEEQLGIQIINNDEWQIFMHIKPDWENFKDFLMEKLLGVFEDFNRGVFNAVGVEEEETGDNN